MPGIFGDVLSGLAKANHEHQLNLMEMEHDEAKRKSALFAELAQSPNFEPQQQEWFLKAAIAHLTDPKEAKKYDIKNGMVQIPADIIKPKQPAAADLAAEQQPFQIPALTYGAPTPTQSSRSPVNPDQFDTQLTPEEETKFQSWKQQYAPRDSGYDYDLRGAFKAGIAPDPKTGHWPDTFKKPNHPTFSVESQYADAAPDRAGAWFGPNRDQYIAPLGLPSAIPGALQPRAPTPLHIPGTAAANPALIAPVAPPPELRSVAQPISQQTQQFRAMEKLRQATEIGEQSKDRQSERDAKEAERLSAQKAAATAALEDKKIQGRKDVAAMNNEARAARAHQLGLKATQLGGDIIDDNGNVTRKFQAWDPSIDDYTTWIEKAGKVKKSSAQGSALTRAVESYAEETGKSFHQAYRELVGLTAEERARKVAEVPRLTQSQREAIVGFDLEGQPVVGTLNTTTVRGGTSGSSAAPSAAQPQAAVGGGGTRTIEGIVGAGQVTPQRNIATRLSESGAQLFVSPDHPDVPALESFAGLAGTGGASKVGGAFNVIKKIMDKDSNNEASAHVGGISIGGGDIATWLSNVTGFTKMVSQSDADVVTNAVKGLTPEEDRALASLMSAYGTVVGLRSATGGSAYKFATDAMERELPAMFNTRDKAAFNYRLAILARELATGFDRLAGDQNKQLAKFYRDTASRLGGTGAPSPAAPPKPAAPSDTVRVINPNGQAGTIPRADLQRALSQGYKEVK